MDRRFRAWETRTQWCWNDRRMNISSMVSPKIGSPCSLTSISPPKSCTPRQRTKESFQACSFIS